MTIEEIRRLLAIAPEYLQILYLAAMTSGLRANELRSLTRRHLDTHGNGLRLDAKWTKNRKGNFQPLPARLVQRLDTFSRSGIVPGLYQQFFRKFMCPADALLYVPSHPARELDKDLARADIPKETPKGKLAFHALRKCYVTLTYEAGATHKEAQALARHSRPELTANIYAEARDERLAGIVDKVGDRVLNVETGAKTGANMVHLDNSTVTDSERNLIPDQPLTPLGQALGREGHCLGPYDSGPGQRRQVGRSDGYSRFRVLRYGRRTARQGAVAKRCVVGLVHGRSQQQDVADLSPGIRTHCRRTCLEAHAAETHAHRSGRHHRQSRAV